MFDLDILEHLLHVPLNLMPKELHARAYEPYSIIMDDFVSYGVIK